MDIEIEEVEQEIKSLKSQLKTVNTNPYFNTQTLQCDRPYIQPISELCGKPQSELDRLYLDCFRPLGAKACSFFTKKHINSQYGKTEQEKRKMKLGSSVLCKKVVKGELTGADAADIIGDELTEQDNAFLQAAGWVAEGYAALATTASVTSCLDRFNMYCDIEANNRKEKTYKQCPIESKKYLTLVSKIEDKKRLLKEKRAKRSIVANDKITFQTDKLRIISEYIKMR